MNMGMPIAAVWRSRQACVFYFMNWVSQSTNLTLAPLGIVDKLYCAVSEHYVNPEHSSYGPPYLALPILILRCDCIVTNRN